MITKMLVDEMERVYKAKVEAVFYCHKPLEHLRDPLVIAALTLWHPTMKLFIPQHKSTINFKYVAPINIASTSEHVKYFGRLPEIPHHMTLYMISHSHIFGFYIQCQRVLSSLNGATLEAMFMSQMPKWMAPTVFATKSS
jgi:hypothetical protein